MAITQIPKIPAKKPKLVCFSFAAYAKTLIHHLNYSLDIPILPGLSESEFSFIETSFKFTFPPDLRSILQEGLPVAHGFPNWRSSSLQQLHILINLPILTLSKQISDGKFWCKSWGTEPADTNEALILGKKLLSKAPVLVPIYRNCYIPSTPNMSGNPVFYVNGGDVRVMSFDVAGFFQDAEFLEMGGFRPSRLLKMSTINAPAWAATVARGIEFWTDVAERGRRRVVARGDTRVWWSGGGELGVCLEEVFWRLRDGGWREEEVWEMMMVMDGGDGKKSESQIMMDEEMSMVLLSGGWSREDVVYSLGFQDEKVVPNGETGGSCVDFQHRNSCSGAEDQKRWKLHQHFLEVHGVPMRSRKHH